MDKLDKTRKMVELCQNYYSIVEEPIAKCDVVTKELYETYKFMVQNTNLDNIKELEEVILFDKSLYLYFNNEKFKNKFISELTFIEPTMTIVSALNSSYVSFKSDPKNKVSNTKWI